MQLESRPQGGCYSLDFEPLHFSFRRAQDGDVLVRRRPDRGVGPAEKQKAPRAGRGRDVRNAAVVSDEDDVFENCGEVRKREIFGELNWLPLPPGLQFLAAAGVGFPRDDQQLNAGREENVAKLDPFFDRPVLCLAAAAGMECDPAIAEMPDGGSIVVVREKARCRVR